MSEPPEGEAAPAWEAPQRWRLSASPKLGASQGLWPPAAHIAPAIGHRFPRRRRGASWKRFPAVGKAITVGGAAWRFASHYPQGAALPGLPGAAPSPGTARRNPIVSVQGLCLIKKKKL